MKKSQSFRQDLASAELGSSPAPPLSPSPQDFPSLPVQPLRPDVILKKNKSMSGALSIEASHQRFRSSIENWSFANEGLKKSIGSLAEQAVPTTQSSESLKTISSLLEEPDMLEQTSVRGEETRWEVPGEQRSWEQNGVWEETPKHEDDPGDEHEESNDTEEDVMKVLSASERPSAGEKSGSRPMSFIGTLFKPPLSHLVLKLHLVRGATNNNDFAEPTHASLAEALKDPPGTKDVAKETAEADCNEGANSLDENLNEVGIEAGPDADGSNGGYRDDYQPDEAEKLLHLTDTGLDNKQTTFTTGEIIDCSTEILESDADPSINSTEVFHKSTLLVEEQNDENKVSVEQDVDKVRENHLEKQEEVTIGAPDILLQGPNQQKPPEQSERQRSKSKSPGRRKLPEAAWNEQKTMSKASKAESVSGGNQRRLSSNAFLERDTKLSDDLVEEEERNTKRKPFKQVEQEQAEVERNHQKDSENENERKENGSSQEKPPFEEDQEEAVELRKPGISPKPVPAPRHFFLRPTGKMANGEFTFN